MRIAEEAYLAAIDKRVRALADQVHELNLQFDQIARDLAVLDDKWLKAVAKSSALLALEVDQPA